jgi:hypothetical protein
LVRLVIHLASLPLFTRIVLGSTVKDNYELKHYG